MKNRSIRARLLIFVIVVVGFIVLNQVLERYCPKRPDHLNIDSTINIQNLYPWPDAKIPLACHLRDLVYSPFAPKLIDYYEVVYKEDGFRILGGYQRRGVVTANIFASGEFLPAFDGSMAGKLPLLADAISFYVDDQPLNMGYIGWSELDVEFHFATILHPLLLPGEHTGRIVLLLPSGETSEYEWQFEITWW